MKRKIILYFIVLILTYVTHAQCNTGTNSSVCRSTLANVVFDELFNANVNNYQASTFPSPYIDLQDNSTLCKKIKVLSYLQYGDGRACFNGSTSYFNSTQYITRAESLLTILEAWDIEPDYSGSSPFNDVDTDHEFFGYINKAHDLNFINGSSFNPDDILTYGDLINLIQEVTNSSYHPVSQNTLDNLNTYFIPQNFQPINLNQQRGLSHGVFDHYAKNSIVIPDRKMNLNFSHFYSTQMVELPQGFFPVKPLGRGWSHTYNSYILKDDIDNDEIYTIVWADGSIHIWNEDNNQYETQSVYDDFDKSSSSRIYITKKNQTRYEYRRLNSNRDIFYLVEIQDPNGNEITIRYENAEANDTKRILEVESPSGKKLAFSYLDETDLVEKITDPIDRSIEFEYNGVPAIWVFQYPVLATFTDPKGNLTTYQYYVGGNSYEGYLLREIRLPRGNVITAEFDNNGRLTSYQVDGDDPTNINVDYDYSNSNLTSVVSSPTPTGGTFTESYSFNDNGLVTNYNSDTDNLQVSYPTSGINILRPTESNSNGVHIDYDYDSRGNVTKIDKEYGEIVEQFQYDNDNNLTRYTDGEGNITKFFYDSDENLIEIEDAEGNSIYYTYDVYGQLLSKTNQENITVAYTYEPDGAISTMSAPANISNSFTYDGVNRLLQSNDNGLVSSYEYDDNDNVVAHTNSGGFVTTYSYDQNDNVLSIVNAHNISTTFTYDDEDRVIQEQFGSLVTQFDYGDEGYLEEIIKPSGNDIDYDYDNDGRLEQTGTITDIDYNQRNLVEDITNSSGQMEFDYDNLNRLEKVKTVHGLNVEYDYTKTNQVEEIVYPTIGGINLEVVYSYDNKNRIQAITVERSIGSGSFTLAQYDYYDDDRVERITLGNNMRINYAYDTAGRFRFIQHENLNTDLVYYTGAHLLNERGNIYQSNDYFTPLPAGHSTHNSSTSTDTYSYDNNNQIIQGNGYSYNVDDDGNTINFDQNNSLVYDIDDRLTSYTDVDNTYSYKYNAYNQRVEATRNGVTTKYVRDVRLDNILVELDSNNNPIQYFIYTPEGMLLCSMMSNGDLQYYHGDIRGSVVMITDEQRAITHQYRYDDFGTITRWSEPANSNNPFRYIGIYGVEYETNDLYYMRARYYKPSTGRFLSEDPIWSTNLYPYADNNPINRIDPKGTDSFHYYNSQGQINNFSKKLYQNFDQMSKYGGYSTIVGTALVGAGLIFPVIAPVAIPIGGTLMKIGSVMSTTGNLTKGIIEYSNTGDSRELMNTSISTVISFGARGMFKSLDVSGANLKFITGGINSKIFGIKSLNEYANNNQ